jgi:Concanavalin A-like lectin/glucanases superfamily
MALQNPTPLNVPGPQRLSTLTPKEGVPAENLPSTLPPAIPQLVGAREVLPGVVSTAPGSAGPSYTEVITADSPALWWRFNEASGTAVADSSGHGRTGLIAAPGSTTYHEPGLITEANQFAIGATDNANFAIASDTSWSVSGAHFSLEWWGTVVPLAALQNFFALSFSSEDAIELLCNDNTGAMSIQPGFANAPITTAPGIFATSGRHHYVLTINGTAIKFYKDGNVIINSTLSFALAGNVNAVAFGSLAALGSPPGNYGGDTDELALYAVALTQTQVVNHHNAGIQAVTAGSSISPDFETPAPPAVPVQVFGGQGQVPVANQ